MSEEDTPLPWWIHWDTTKGCYQVRFNIDFDKVCVDHTQGLINKDLLDDDWEKESQDMRDKQIG